MVRSSTSPDSLVLDNPTEWFALSSKNKYAGEVYLELTFWSNVRHIRVCPMIVD